MLDKQAGGGAPYDSTYTYYLAGWAAAYEKASIKY